MKVELRRIIRPAPFESLEFTIEVTEADLSPKPEPITPRQQLARLHEFAYRNMLAFMCFHGQLTIEQAKQEIERFKAFYHVE